MKIVKPSLKGMANTKYLGHFAQDKYIQQGHNDDGKVTVEEFIERAREGSAFSMDNVAKQVDPNRGPGFSGTTNDGKIIITKSQEDLDRALEKANNKSRK